MNRILLLAATLFFSFSFVLFAVSSVSAQTTNLRGQITDQVQAGAKGAGIKGTPKNPQELVVSVIQVFLSILGMVFLVLVLLAGYWYVTAKGDETKVEKAQSTIQSAVIGLAVILMAYTITYFVGKKFSAAVSEGGHTTNDTVRTPGRCNFYVDGRSVSEDGVVEHDCLQCSAPRYNCIFIPMGGE